MANGWGTGRRRRRRGGAGELAGGQHEAAADRVVGLLRGAGCRRRPRPRAPGRWRGRGAAGRSRRRGRARGRRRARAGRAARRGRSRRCAPAPRRRAAASKSAGSKPARPRITARSVAWPLPVKARLPCSRQPSRAGSPEPGTRSAPARSGSRKRPAATIGPMVCEDEGPTPTLKMSKTLRNIRRSPAWRGPLEASRRGVVSRNATGGRGRRRQFGFRRPGNAPITPAHRSAGGPDPCRSRRSIIAKRAAAARALEMVEDGHDARARHRLDGRLVRAAAVGAHPRDRARRASASRPRAPRSGWPRSSACRCASPRTWAGST